MLACSPKTASGGHDFVDAVCFLTLAAEGREVHREKRIEYDQVASNFRQDGIEELAEYGGGTRLARYDHDPSRIDVLLGQIGATAVTKVHAVTDVLGSVYALRSASGDEVTRYSYDAYGARTAEIESVPTKWGFTGRVHEAGVPGAMYYRAREYYSEFGRFDRPDQLLNATLSSPPVRLRTYWYADANPANGRDPSGWLFFAREGTQLQRGVAAELDPDAALVPIPDTDWQLAEEGYKIVLGIAVWPACRDAVTAYAAQACPSTPLPYRLVETILEDGTLWYWKGAPDDEFGISFHNIIRGSTWPKQAWTLGYSNRSRTRRSVMAATMLHEVLHIFDDPTAAADERAIELVVYRCGLPPI